MDELKQYLNRFHTKGTVKRYFRELELFFSSVETHKTASYSLVMAYLGKLRERYPNRNIAPSLYAIKRYYQFLVDTNQREDNPAASIKLRDKICRDIQLQDLFSSAELEALLDRKERYKVLKNRNKVIHK